MNYRLTTYGTSPAFFAAMAITGFIIYVAPALLSASTVWMASYPPSFSEGLPEAMQIFWQAIMVTTFVLVLASPVAAIAILISIGLDSDLAPKHLKKSLIKSASSEAN